MGEQPHTAREEEVGTLPLEFPCPEWLGHFLFTEGTVCQAGGVLGKGAARSWLENAMILVKTVVLLSETIEHSMPGPL